MSTYIDPSPHNTVADINDTIRQELERYMSEDARPFTNGDLLQAAFPTLKITAMTDTYVSYILSNIRDGISCASREWWDSIYKEENYEQ